jgi:putative membrane protein
MALERGRRIMHGFLGTKADFWWDLTVTSETVVFSFLGLGGFFGRKHRGTLHHNTMLISAVLVAAWFLMYLAQQYIVGIIGFGGPDFVKYLVYYPVIIFHSLVSTAALVLTGIVVFNGFISSTVESGQRVLVKNPLVHRRLGWVTLICFIFSVITAYSVYAMLFIIYNPARTPSYGFRSSIGALSGIGSFLILALMAVLYYISRVRNRNAVP